MKKAASVILVCLEIYLIFVSMFVAVIIVPLFLFHLLGVLLQ